jgi:hypothetical protein
MLDALTQKQEHMIPQLKADFDLAIVVKMEKVQHNMLTELQPIFQLFAVTLTSKTMLGNNHVPKTRTPQGQSCSGNHHCSDQHFCGWHSCPSCVTWGMGSLNLPPPVSANPQVTPSGVSTLLMMSVTGKLQNLDESIKNIKPQLIAEWVELGCVNFPSRAAVKAWLKIEALADMAYVFFLDPHLSMNIGYLGIGDSAEQLGLQAVRQRGLALHPQKKLYLYQATSLNYRHLFLKRPRTQASSWLFQL